MLRRTTKCAIASKEAMQFRLAMLQSLPLTLSTWKKQKSILTPNPHFMGDKSTSKKATAAATKRINMKKATSKAKSIRGGRKLGGDADNTTNKKKTLVLDLDDTLVSAGLWRPRPHADRFLDCAFANFDVVFWTRSDYKNAEEKVEILGATKRSPHDILAGWSEDFLDGRVKDLKRLKRPMNQVLLIDADYDHISLQPRSQWVIPRWTPGMKRAAHDAVLLEGVHLLEAVAAAPTVQEALDPFIVESYPTQLTEMLEL